MPLPSLLQGRLELPLIGAPMIAVCHPPLTIAQCTSGIVGAFPALSARPQELLEQWLVEIKEALAKFAAAHPERKVAPFAVNQISHRSNARLEQDLETCIRHQVPVIITSLGPSSKIVEAVHAYGGIVLHDVSSSRHAEKALAEGVDGLVLLCAGGGGLSGTLNPFAFVTEVRRFYKGFIAVSGGITGGRALAAVRALGADAAYMGTRFIASAEARAGRDYQAMIMQCRASDILFTPHINGVPGSFLRPSIVAAGLDPDHLEPRDKSSFDINRKEQPKAWSNIWSAGHGVGNIREVLPVADIVARLESEYQAALSELCSPAL
jgi:nitronate monooxygenase